jgi:hypothetical protein
MSPEVLVAGVDAYITQGITARLTSRSGALASGAQTVSIIDAPVTLLASINASTTVTFTNVPDDFASTWFVEISNRGSNTVTFSGVTWDGGSAPALATTGKTVLEFYSRDGGATIYGRARFLSIA